MSTPTRDELIERMRRTSREQVVLEQMIRLGFWPPRGTKPEDPAEDIIRRTEIYKELQKLRSEGRQLKNEERLKKAARKRRLEESRLRQQETKERRERERAERAAVWRERKSREIVYLGRGVSSGLSAVECDAVRLAERGLSPLGSAEEIAAAMGLEVAELRFLAFSREVSTTSHYVRFAVPKKTGGLRVISAPMPRLKAAQEWMLRNVLDRVEAHEAAHGFRAGRSIVTNAAPHVGADCVVNLDLEDFFPSITYRRVKGVFRALGYSEAAATVFALLATAHDVEEAELDGRRYFVATSERRLPQGAPTSPAITNVLCRRLDRRLAKLADGLGFVYTRYADDLTFSASGAALANLCNLLAKTRAIVAHEGLRVNERKTRVLRRSRRLEVTGLVVNDGVGVSRDTLRRFRATLYQIERDGPEGKRWGASGDVLASIVGFANFVAMVDPAKGAPLRARALAVAARHGWRPAARPASPEPPDEPPEAPPGKKWWKVF
jgi:retron-type reverse transcriptase